jgi:hypothetical protein
MNENSQGQIILVTGAGSGIGRTTAIELARGGHIVYASMRVADLEGERWASLRSVASEERLDLRPLELDVQEGRITGSTARFTRSQDTALRSRICNTWSGRNASVRPCIIIAALFIATSTRPSSARMRSIAARQLASAGKGLLDITTVTDLCCARSCAKRLNYGPRRTLP